MDYVWEMIVEMTVQESKEGTAMTGNAIGAAQIALHRPTYVEVDVDCIRKNVKTFLSLLKPETKLMAIVKADAYGHGAVPVARTAIEAGAQWLGVALTQEAAQLRDAGFQQPILVLGYTDSQDYAYMAARQIRPAIYSLEQGLAFGEAAQAAGVKASIHIKVDTGMGRLGFQPGEEALQQILRLARHPYIEIEGLFTHFAKADENDQTSVKGQAAMFKAFSQQIKNRGVAVPICHCANTAAAMKLPEAHMDMIRLGIGLYGLYPSEESKQWGIQLAEAISLKSCLSHVKAVPAGTAVSYGHTWTAVRSSVIGTVPIGYADGVSRHLSNRGTVLVNGQRAPIVGRVCMDQLMVDLTGLPEAATGQPVVLLGQQGAEKIPVDEVAMLLNTINYEIVCDLSCRLPRRYVNV